MIKLEIYSKNPKELVYDFETKYKELNISTISAMLNRAKKELGLTNFNNHIVRFDSEASYEGKIQ